MNNNQIRSSTFWLLACLVGLLVLALIIIGLTWRNLRPPVSAPGPSAPAVAAYDLGQEAQYLQIDSPTPGAKLKSPLTITGQARRWYFEGSFPVVLKDGKGNVLASGPAQAQGNWTSDNFVPFTITLSFDQPSAATGTLIFKKDNPSGLPANDDQAAIAVNFDLSAAPPAVCRPSGCSGQVCSDQDLITDCLYLPEYACYKNATCARQSDGTCGWTSTPALSACIAKAKK